MTDKGKTNQESFIPKHKNVRCYEYGNQGHYANKCPDGNNNDKASTRSNQSTAAATAGITAPLDGVASMMVSHYWKQEA
jgi:hypothetical protein